MGAERVFARTRRLELALLGERQRRDIRKATGPLRARDIRLGQLLAIEDRALEEVGDLLAIALIVDRELLGPWTRLDVRRQHHPPPASA